MEPNQSLFFLSKMKKDKYRAEMRQASYNQIYSLKRTVPPQNTHDLSQNISVYNPLKKHQIQEWVLKIKQSVAEIVQCEKNMDIQKLRNLLFFLLEDLKNNDVPNFSTANMEEINFFSIFRLIMCNSEYLKDEDLSYNMIWILGILLDNENITFEFLKEQKLIEFLYFLLNKASIKIQSMCCFIFAHLFSAGEEIRNYCLTMGILNYILSFANKDDVPKYFLINLIGLANSFFKKPLPPYEQTKQLLPLLTQVIDKTLIRHLDNDTLIDVLVSLNEISNGTQQQIDDLIALKVHFKTIDICFKYNMNDSIGKFSLRILGNLITGENYSTEKVIDAGLLKILQLYYDASNLPEEALLEMCWIFSNIFACNEELIEKVIQSPIIDYLFQIPTKSRHQSFMREGAQMIYNLSKTAKFKQIIKLSQKGFLDLIDFVCDSEDKNSLIKLSKGITKILRKELDFNGETKFLRIELEKKGVDKKIRQLLTHEEAQVFYYAEIALNFLEKE